MKYLLCCIAIILGVLFFTYQTYPSIPDKMTTHWDELGKPNGSMDKLYGSILVPGIMIFLLVLFAFLPNLDPKKSSLHKEWYYQGFVILMMFFLGAMQIWMILWNTNVKIPIALFMPILLGFFSVYLGIIFPKIKPNWFFGIRTPWTLSSDKTWNKTHKFAGKIFIIAGLICVFSILTPLSFWISLCSIALAAIVSVGYSYFVFQK